MLFHKPTPNRTRVERLSTAEEQAEKILSGLWTTFRNQPPEGTTRTEVEVFIRDWGDAVKEQLTHKLQAREARLKLPAEFWGRRDRTKANLAAMKLLASKDPRRITPDDRLVLAKYSGWGGLSIENVVDQFPQNFPIPDHRALIHEYYPFFPYPLRSHEIKHLRDIPIRSDRVTDVSAG